MLVDRVRVRLDQALVVEHDLVSTATTTGSAVPVTSTTMPGAERAGTERRSVIVAGADDHPAAPAQTPSASAACGRSVPITVATPGGSAAAARASSPA